MDRHIDVMEEMNYEKWDAAIGPLGPNCTSVDRIQQRKDRQHYEDKFMCSYNDLSLPSTEDAGECHMMSIGSNDQWGFESAVLQHAKHCQLHTFDCTVTTPKHKPDSRNVTFYSICIAGEDRDDNETGRKYRTYDAMWKMTGMRGPPRLLKMDVEGFEYDVLSSMMPKSTFIGPEYLPEQIVVELHYASRMYDLPWMLRARQASEISMLVSHMYRAGGYLPVHVDYNPGCAPCLEVLFVKVLCQAEQTL